MKVKTHGDGPDAELGSVFSTLDGVFGLRLGKVFWSSGEEFGENWVLYAPDGSMAFLVDHDQNEGNWLVHRVGDEGYCGWLLGAVQRGGTLYGRSARGGEELGRIPPFSSVAELRMKLSLSGIKCEGDCHDGT